MLRLLVSPKWIAWHVLTLGAMVACGFLSAWQWHRAGSAMGSALNIGYGVQWPVFAVFFGFMWWHFLRMELRELRSTSSAVASEEGAAPEIRSPGERVPENSSPTPGPVADVDTGAGRGAATDDRRSPFTPRPAGVEPSRLSDPQLRAYNDALAELAARDQEN